MEPIRPRELPPTRFVLPLIKRRNVVKDLRAQRLSSIRQRSTGEVSEDESVMQPVTIREVGGASKSQLHTLRNASTKVLSSPIAAILSFVRELLFDRYRASVRASFTYPSDEFYRRDSPARATQPRSANK